MRFSLFPSHISDRIMGQPVSSTLCNQCQQRPRFQEPGKKHLYCGRTCANEAALKNGVCELCKRRPRFYDHESGILHPYCSRTCANNAKSSRTEAASNKTARPEVAHNNGVMSFLHGKSKAHSHHVSGQNCQIPGCQKPRSVNVDGTLNDYCSQSHITLAQNACLMCRTCQKTKYSHFCGKTCTTKAEALGPVLFNVPPGHVTFNSVSHQFETSWRHKTAVPPVRRVYKILLPKGNVSAYEAYKLAVEAEGGHVAAGRQAGNERRRWHGTKRVCNLGDPGQESFCSSPECSLCLIIKSSFQIRKCGDNTKWSRFGRGIYTSSTSSKSNDYSRNDYPKDGSVGSNYKVLLLNKVVVGRGYKVTSDNPNLIAPPVGYNSVLAETGGSLNYDELIVYDEHAIQPSFLVVYEP